MRQKIDYKGLTRLPSDIASFDGEMEEVIDLVNVHGELRPYVKPEQIGQLDGKLMFVHKNEGWEHFITWDGATVKAYDYVNNHFSLIGSVLSVSNEELIQIEAIGNILVVLTNREVRYSLWKSGGYKYLGNELPFPELSFSLGTLQAVSVGIDIEGFSEDVDKLWKTDGYNSKGGEPATGSSGGRTDGNYRQHDEGSIPAGINPMYDPDRSVVSVEFENMVRGAINSRLETFRKNGAFIFPFFIRYALRLYDGTLTKHSPPILMTPTKFYPFEAGLKAGVGGSRPTEDKVWIRMQPSELKYSHSALASGYEDIITSVDVFMSEPIYTYKQNGVINGLIDKPDELVSSSIDKIFGGIFYDKDTTLRNIGECGHFFKILSIPYEDMKSSESAKTFKPESTEYLIHNELMTDEYQSHHKISAKRSFTYNHRLHLSGVIQKITNGFYYGEYMHYFVADMSATSSASINRVGANPFIYYPDRRASSFQATKSRNTPQGEEYVSKTIKLSEHSALNGSYFLNPTLEPYNTLRVDVGETIISPIQIGTLAKGQREHLGSTLFVSNVQNPFVFGAGGRVTLPVGEIITVSSNTEAISAGQFGQFPLFLFTDDGVWAMEVSTDGRYMTRQPISREVCINPNILQMDKHIAFISKKGLTILSGADNECITDIIREVNTRTAKISVTELATALDIPHIQTYYHTDTIEEYMQGCELAYEYLNGKGRIYLINGAYPYSWMFDIESKSWSKVSGQYRNSVNNYPDSYVQQSDGKLFNLASIRESGERTMGVYITRPITMDEALFQLKRVMHSGIFERHHIATAVYASRDGQQYDIVATSKNRLMRMSGSPYRYFKLCVIADLKATDVLSFLEVERAPRYINRMR